MKTQKLRRQFWRSYWELRRRTRHVPTWIELAALLSIIERTA